MLGSMRVSKEAELKSNLYFKDFTKMSETKIKK